MTAASMLAMAALRKTQRPDVPISVVVLRTLLLSHSSLSQVTVLLRSFEA